MTIDEIESRLRPYKAKSLAVPPPKRAAVSLVVHHRHSAPEILLIQRAERDGDPWSGHMGLPGGRYHPSDRDLHDTAVRETFEEIGLDLRAQATRITALDDLPAVGRGRVLDLVITPFVHVVNAPDPELRIDPREVQHALWVPVAALEAPRSRATHIYDFGGVRMTAPALSYAGYTIWGLTYRILRQFLDLAGDEAPPGRRTDDVDCRGRIP